MGILSRIRALFGGGAPKVIDARDPFERELLAHDVDAMKADEWVSAGDAGAAAALPEVTGDEVYHAFEHDEEAPPDAAP